jgi:lysozyme family protein
MKSNLDECLAHIVKHEGGFAIRDTEGGGAVNMGVTFTVFRAWRLNQKKPDPTFNDLKAMTLEEAKAIYAKQYAEPVRFKELRAGIDYCMLDAAVNGGVTGAIKVLQEALRVNTVDGHFGAVTWWAARNRPLKDLINAFCNTRIARYSRLKRFNQQAVPGKNGKPPKTWGQIWTARIETVRTRALNMMETANA